MKTHPFNWTEFLADEHPTKGAIERAIQAADEGRETIEARVVSAARAELVLELNGLRFFSARGRRDFALSALVNCRQAHAKLRQLLEISAEQY
jgi:hypothetical protein